MRESLQTYFVDRYTKQLHRELYAEGLSQELTDDTLREAQAHLEDAMEGADPQTAAEAEAVVTAFGSPSRMAKRLGAEQLRLSVRGRFLWPMIAAPIGMYLSMNPVPQARLFGGMIYCGTLYILLTAIVLFVLGLRARRPMLGQFAGLVAGLIVAQLAWYGATSYPTAYQIAGGDTFYSSVKRGDYVKQLASLNGGIDRAQEAARRIELGRQVFNGPEALALVPSELTYQGKYWFPEGIRELGLGISPSEINPLLLTSSWREAVGAYNGDGSKYGWPDHPWDGDAARQLKWIPQEISSTRGEIGYLTWISSQPIGTQLVEDLKMVASRTLFMGAFALVCSNVGWLTWLLFRQLGKVGRRMRWSPA